MNILLLDKYPLEYNVLTGEYAAIIDLPKIKDVPFGHDVCYVYYSENVDSYVARFKLNREEQQIGPFKKDIFERKLIETLGEYMI